MNTALWGLQWYVAERGAQELHARWADQPGFGMWSERDFSEGMDAVGLRGSGDGTRAMAPLDSRSRETTAAAAAAAATAGAGEVTDASADPDAFARHGRAYTSEYGAGGATLGDFVRRVLDGLPGMSAAAPGADRPPCWGNLSWVWVARDGGPRPSCSRGGAQTNSVGVGPNLQVKLRASGAGGQP